MKLCGELAPLTFGKARAGVRYRPSHLKCFSTPRFVCFPKRRGNTPQQFCRNPSRQSLKNDFLFIFPFLTFFLFLFFFLTQPTAFYKEEQLQAVKSVVRICVCMCMCVCIVQCSVVQRFLFLSLSSLSLFCPGNCSQRPQTHCKYPPAQRHRFLIRRQDNRWREMKKRRE